MQVKLLRQAAGRDDRIVAAYEDVTFLNEHVGWYPIIKDRFRKANDIVVVVLRVGDVCFEAGSMFRRGMLRKEYIEARTAEARNLRAAVQRRMASCQWIPSSYVAAYEALGWDARPLKGHRTRMRELYAAEVTLIKDSSLISVLGATELLYSAQILGANTFNLIPPLLASAVLYLIMTLTTSYFARKIERRLSVSD